MCMDYIQTDCVWTTYKQIVKFEALIVSDVLGSGFFCYVFGRVFHFGDVLGSGSDVNKPTVCNLVMLMKCNLF